MADSKAYTAFRKAERKCNKEGKLTNPKTHRCIKKDASVGKRLLNKARNDRKGFEKDLSDLEYGPSEIPKVMHRYAAEVAPKAKLEPKKKKAKLAPKAKPATEKKAKPPLPDKYYKSLEKMTDCCERNRKLYMKEKEKTEKLASQLVNMEPGPPLKRPKKPSDVEAIRAAAAAGAAAATSAVQSGIIKPADAPNLAAQAASAAVTVSPTGVVTSLVIRRKPKPGTSASAATTQNAVAAAAAVIDNKFGADTSKGTLDKLVRQVSQAQRPGTAASATSFQSHEERMRDLMERMAPSISYKAVEEVEEEDIYNNRLGKNGACSKHYLFVIAGDKPTVAQEAVISKFEGADVISISKLPETMHVLERKCVVFVSVPFPDDSTVKKMRAKKGRDAMREIIRVVIISDEYNANDFGLTVLEEISGEMMDMFEGYHTLKEFAKQYKRS